MEPFVTAKNPITPSPTQHQMRVGALENPACFHLFPEKPASDAGGVESFSDISVFFLSTRQMKQIRPYVWKESAENGLAGVTLSNNSPALLYIHQSAVSYLGQLYTRVCRGPRGTRRLNTEHFSLMQAHFLRNYLYGSELDFGILLKFVPYMLCK